MELWSVIRRIAVVGLVVVVPIGAGGGLASEVEPAIVADGGAGYLRPVAGEVIDPFRAPDGAFGAGNRGVDIATTPGDAVRSPATGTVAFAGPVVGNLVVSIDHPDGLRSTLTGLGSIEVTAGDEVDAATVVGRAGRSLQVGLRAGAAYIDPTVVWPTSVQVRLVPLPAWAVPPSR